MQQQIATGVALVYKTVYGRGPTKVTAHTLPDTIVVILEDVNTAGQTMLVELDEIGLVNTVHSRLQRGIAPKLVDVIEELTGRRVRSYVPGFDAVNGTATDTFLLEPTGEHA